MMNVCVCVCVMLLCFSQVIVLVGIGNQVLIAKHCLNQGRKCCADNKYGSYYLLFTTIILTLIECKTCNFSFNRCLEMNVSLTVCIIHEL